MGISPCRSKIKQELLPNFSEAAPVYFHPCPDKNFPKGGEPEA